MSRNVVHPASATLPYAPVIRRGFVRRFWRTGLILLVALMVGVAWHWSRSWRVQAAYAYWQRQCLTFDRPETAIAYEESATSTATLRSADSRYFVPSHPVFNTPGDRAPDGWSPPALYVPRAWEKLGSPDSGRDIDAVAFLHERAVGGIKRLAVVALAPTGFGADGHRLVFTARPYTPAPFTPGARVQTPQRRWQLIVRLDASQRLRVFSGQFDPQRSDHFTIRFEINGEPGTIDGWLRDRAWAKAQDYRTWWTEDECVELRVRDGPGDWVEN